MNVFRLFKCLAGSLFWMVLGVVAVGPMGVLATTEQTFDVLQIGTRTYTNVTVTANTKSYVFLMHAGGILNLKVAELPSDLRSKLGYNAVSQPAETKTSSAAAWVKQNASKLEVPNLKQFEQKFRSSSGVATIHLDAKQLYPAIGAAVFLFLAFCYCCGLICQKAGKEPGLLIWLPLLQAFPLLRAAGMSYLWFLAFCVPVLNILAQIVWSVKISRARGKSGWVAFWLLLPVTNLLAFLYLAFSDGGAKPEGGKESRPKLMSVSGPAEFALGA